MAEWTSTAPLADWVDAAERIVRHKVGTGIARGEIESLADSVALWLSRYEPRTVVDSTLDGDGSTYDFALSSLTVAWSSGFSRLKWVETPNDEQSRRRLDPQEYELYPDTDAPTHLRFLLSAPDSGTNNISLAYTVPHTVSTTSTTVPSAHQPGYEYALACQLAKLKAAEYSDQVDSFIAADSTDSGGRGSQWLRLAEVWCDLASQALGVDIGGGTSGGSAAAADAMRPASGRLDHDPNSARWPRLVHRRSSGTRGR